MSMSMYRRSTAVIRALSVALALAVNALATLMFAQEPSASHSGQIAAIINPVHPPRIDLGCLRGVEVRAPRRIAAIAAAIR